MIDGSVESIDVVAFLMMADAFGLRDHRGSCEDAQAVAIVVKIGDDGIIGASLSAPF